MTARAWELSQRQRAVLVSCCCGGATSAGSRTRQQRAPLLLRTLGVTVKGLEHGNDGPRHSSRSSSLWAEQYQKRLIVYIGITPVAWYSSLLDI